MGWGGIKHQSEKEQEGRVHLVQLSVRDGGYFILLIYVSLKSCLQFRKKDIYIYKHALLHSSLNIIFIVTAT